MAVWRIISRSYLKYASKQLTRNYSQVCLATSLTNAFKHTKLSSFDIPHSDICRRPSSHLFENVRSLATSAQTRKKEEEVESDGPRLNDKIIADTVRLVSEEGHCVVSLREALRRARELKLDLVEVQKDAKPPVCKIIDYSHEKYKKAKVGKERAKAKRAEVTIRSEVKEIRFTPKIEAKDLQFKAKQALKMMESGYRVKCLAVPDKDKSKELEPEKLLELLSRFTCYLGDALVEFGPEASRGDAVVVVRHAKFGPPKKGKAIKLKEMNMKTSARIKDDTPKPDSSEAGGGSTVDDDQEDIETHEPELAAKQGQNRYPKREPPSSSDLSGGRDANRFEPQSPNQHVNPQRPRFQNQAPNQQPNGRFDPQSPNQPPTPPMPRFPNQQPPGRFDPQSPNQPPTPPRPRFPDQAPNQQQPSGPSPNRQGPPPRFQNQAPNQQPQPPTPPPRPPPRAPPRPQTRLPNEDLNQQPTGPGRSSGPSSGYGIFSTPKTK
uniref:Translation initiation factor IF-3 n=1 Tax=Noccaea caerulescens TaxID=107243 RepID=A0A1J3DZ41_NOCCA